MSLTLTGAQSIPRTEKTITVDQQIYAGEPIFTDKTGRFFGQPHGACCDALKTTNGSNTSVDALSKLAQFDSTHFVASVVYRDAEASTYRFGLRYYELHPTRRDRHRFDLIGVTPARAAMDVVDGVYWPAVISLSSTVGVVCYIASGLYYLVPFVVNPSTGSITLGSRASSGSASYGCNIVPIDSTTFLHIYRSGITLYTSVFTTNGSTVTYQSQATTTSDGNMYYADKIASNKIILSSAFGTSTYVYLISVSGTTATIGSMRQQKGATALYEYFSSAVNIGGNKALCCSQSGLVTLDCSGSSPSIIASITDPEAGYLIKLHNGIFITPQGGSTNSGRYARFDTNGTLLWMATEDETFFSALQLVNTTPLYIPSVLHTTNSVIMPQLGATGDHKPCVIACDGFIDPVCIGVAKQDIAAGGSGLAMLYGTIYAGNASVRGEPIIDQFTHKIIGCAISTSEILML